MKRDIKIRTQDINRDARELTNINLVSAVYPGLPENFMYALCSGVA